MRFRNSQCVPPVPYCYELGGERVVSLSRRDIEAKARALWRALRKGEKMPDNFFPAIEDCTCRRAPEGFCYGAAEGIVEHALTVQQIRTNTDKIVAAGKRTTPGVIRQRSEVCAACKRNSMQICPGCTGVSEWAARRAGRIPVPFDNHLGVCMCLGVFVAALVSLDVDITPGSTYPDACWRK